MSWAANNIVEVRISYVVNQQRCMNVFHYHTATDTTGRTPLELTDDLLTKIMIGGVGSLLGQMEAFMSQDATFDRVSVQGVYPTRYRSLEDNPAANGSLATPCNAQNIQASIKKHGDVASRHSIGANHFGGIPDDGFVGGFLTAGQLGLSIALANAVKSRITTAGPVPADYDPVILNKTPIEVDGKTKFIISGFTPVTGVESMETLRVMNRRTVGRGI